MGYSLFSNSYFQMGVTVMGFAEHFGQCLEYILNEIRKSQHDLCRIKKHAKGFQNFKQNVFGISGAYPFTLGLINGLSFYLKFFQRNCVSVFMILIY